MRISHLRPNRNCWAPDAQDQRPVVRTEGRGGVGLLKAWARGEAGPALAISPPPDFGFGMGKSQRIADVVRED